jgi:hypothetical protein
MEFEAFAWANPDFGQYQPWQWIACAATTSSSCLDGRSKPRNVFV